jgi:hypothetical protein
MQQPSLKYHQATLGYLEKYYQSFADESFYFGYSFIKKLFHEGEKIAKAEGLEGMNYANALMIVCFRFAGITNILIEEDTKYKLLHDFAEQINYPVDDLKKVEGSIHNNINYNYPVNPTENVAWDAISYRFAIDDLIVQVSFLKEEMNRINQKQYTEFEILSSLKEQFTHNNFITDFAKVLYAEKKDKNFIKLEKRIQKLEQTENKSLIESGKLSANLTDKETEDLFKIAFRNYVHLVSVADSKASLLINVNSIIISVVIAFVVSNSDKYPFLTLPSLILITVAFITILLSILASRPQRYQFIQNKSSTSYQTFFFGSFDLIGNEFSKANWNNYSAELDALLKGGKEKVYEEMYKETFNVRKVLGKKFTYLSIAYWVFIAGLFISILSFFLNTYKG